MGESDLEDALLDRLQELPVRILAEQIPRCHQGSQLPCFDADRCVAQFGDFSLFHQSPALQIFVSVLGCYGTHVPSSSCERRIIVLGPTRLQHYCLSEEGAGIPRRWRSSCMWDKPNKRRVSWPIYTEWLNPSGVTVRPGGAVDECDLPAMDAATAAVSSRIPEQGYAEMLPSVCDPRADPVERPKSAREFRVTCLCSRVLFDAQMRCCAVRSGRSTIAGRRSKASR
jgi:hypothetical protein